MCPTLVEDGVLQPPTDAALKPSELLAQHAGAIYTAAIFCRDRGLVDWELHERRLLSSIQALSADQSCSAEPEQTEDNPATLLEATTAAAAAAAVSSSLEMAVDDFVKGNAAQDWRHAMVTVLIEERTATSTADPPALRVLVLICAVTPPPADKPVVVGVYGRPRQSPGIKRARWAIERQPLEVRKSADMSEVLLSTEDGRLCEGLITNFFVVTASADGQPLVQTAPADLVLPGVLRARVLQACERLGLAVLEA